MKGLESRKWMVLPYLLIFGVALLRLEVSHPHNFMPVFSRLLFFAATSPAKEFALPLLGTGVDIVLTTHQYGYPLSSGHAVTWLSYLAVLMLGAGVSRNSISARRRPGKPGEPMESHDDKRWSTGQVRSLASGCATLAYEGTSTISGLTGKVIFDWQDPGPHDSH